jgi:hypothetical protein
MGHLVDHGEDCPRPPASLLSRAVTFQWAARRAFPQQSRIVGGQMGFGRQQGRRRPNGQAGWSRSEVFDEIWSCHRVREKWTLALREVLSSTLTLCSGIDRFPSRSVAPPKLYSGKASRSRCRCLPAQGARRDIIDDSTRLLRRAARFTERAQGPRRLGRRRMCKLVPINRTQPVLCIFSRHMNDVETRGSLSCWGLFAPVDGEAASRGRGACSSVFPARPEGKSCSF